VTITHIWTKFGTEHKYHTTNTPEWPNSHNLKIQYGGGRHLEFRKNVNNFGLDKNSLRQIICEDAQRRRRDDHVTKGWNRKLICVTSSNEGLKHIASISVTITDFWTKFGTEHKYHTVNMPEWPSLHKLKIPDGGGRHLEFRKNVNNFGLDKDILHQIIWEDAPRPRRDDHVIKSWNRKLMRVRSSNEGLKHICVDLSDYNRQSINQYSFNYSMTECRPHIKNTFEPNLVQNTNTTLSTRRNGQIHINWKSKMAAVAILNFGIMSITLDWIKISCIKLYGKILN